MSVLLVHSPLLGPSSWARVASVLEGRGYEVAVPDLTDVADAATPRWLAFVDTAVADAGTLPGPIAAIGHSGAGAFLPAIGQRLGQSLRRLVFVDAVIPPQSGAHVTPSALKAMLDQQTRDGHLRRWLEWWPDDVIDQLLPHPSDRQALINDMPHLPRSFYDESVPVPDGWSDRECAYLKLSEAYADEFEEADTRGWARIELDANHLSIHTEPERIANTLDSLLGPA